MKAVNLNSLFKLAVSGVIYSAVVLSTVAPLSAHASLKDAMSEMFLTSGTEAQSINTQRLRGFYGGSLSIRSPGRSFQIVQFAAPKIDAGCGGIDIFFGSFSFINGAQFEQLIRAIAANAVGYAVKLAISSMCNPCGAIIQTIEDAIRELNALAKNTCAVTMATMDKIGVSDKIQEFGRKVGESLGVAANRTADTAAAANKSHQEPPTKTAKGGDENTAASNPILGNMVWRASQKTMDAGNNTLRVFMDTKTATEMVQSVFGTMIVRGKEEGDGDCSAGTSAERCDNKPVNIRSSISKWEKLLKARTHSPDGTSMVRCINADCTKTETRTVPLSEWGGVQDIVNIALFGTVDIHNASSYTPDSLIGSFILKRPIGQNGGNLSVRARQMADIIPMPIILMLMELQKTPGAAKTLGLQLSLQLPKYFEYIIALELLNIASNTFSNQTEVEMPEHFRTQLSDMSAQLNTMMPQTRDVSDMIDGAFNIVRNSQILTSSPVRSAPKN